ncbi:MAG: hypothetical protein HYV62_09320 [Candidatus Rokubacteria bacterium]|nr:hypothetical protein [Candidatus Rokubacteria bacterium]
MRTAATAPGGFTPWLGGPLLASGIPLGAGQYWARIDNDCNPLVPTAIQEGAQQVPPPPCNLTGPDQNEVGVLTAWAETSSGVGRSRVRAVVGVDNPWKHVCSDVKADGNGYCNDPSNANGNPKITPADPNDPNGPNGYDDLPRPILGCSTIDPTMHGSTTINCPPGDTFTWDPATSTYRHVTTSAAPLPGARLVLMGENPALNPAAKVCYEDTVAGKYWGYFDCALQTPCDGNIDSALGPSSGKACGDIPGNIQPACVRPGDTRAAAIPSKYKVVGANGCPGLGGANVVNGMVLNWYPNAAASRPIGRASERNPKFDGRIGSCPVATSGATFNCVPPVGSEINGRNLYVLRDGGGAGTGQVTFDHTGAGETYMYGTIVVEGNGVNPGCGGAGTNDVGLYNRSILTTAQRNMTQQTETGQNSYVYGYPVTLIVFDPIQATTAPIAPTANPYNPQNTCADMGSANTAVNGMIYSGGHIQFNPINMNGTVIAFEIQTQGGANAGIGYNSTYGYDTPPPGFPIGAGNQVVIIRKSFIVCTSYNDESGGATPCN